VCEINTLRQIKHKEKKITGSRVPKTSNNKTNRNGVLLEKKAKTSGSRLIVVNPTTSAAENRNRVNGHTLRSKK
jgi:hypothetical protein